MESRMSSMVSSREATSTSWLQGKLDMARGGSIFTGTALGTVLVIQGDVGGERGGDE